MARNFLKGAGLVAATANRKSSAYKIAGGSLGRVLTQQGVVNKGVILIDGVIIKDKDIVLPVTALDDYRVLYRFGKDFGNVQIVGTIYLGPVDCGNGRNSKLVKQLASAFEQDRVSNHDTPIKVSIASGEAYPCYPFDLTFAQVDADKNSIKYTIECILAPVQSGGK